MVTPVMARRSVCSTVLLVCVALSTFAPDGWKPFALGFQVPSHFVRDFQCSTGAWHPGKTQACGLRFTRKEVASLRMQATEEKTKPREQTETLGERYLRESNQCRPLTSSFVRIYDNSAVAENTHEHHDVQREQSCVVSFKLGDKTVVTTPEVAVTHQFEALFQDLQRQGGEGAAEITCFGDKSRCKELREMYGECNYLPYVAPVEYEPLCTVALCEDGRPALPSRLLDAGLRSSPSFARTFLGLASSRLAQRTFPRLPWPLQRWIVGKVGRVEALLAMRRYDKAVETANNPLLRRWIKPVLDASECACIIEDAEQYGAATGWTTSRHKTHATTDIPIQRLPAAAGLWNQTVAPRVQEAISSAYGFRPADVTPVDVFVVKYSAEGSGQRELSVHRDGALMTFSLLLNSPADFEGGGTYFEEAGAVYRPERGVAVFHSGKVRHGGYPITAGVRYVLVDHPTLRPELKEWRWGSPSWYLSSAVVSDAEILDRIYLPPGAAESQNADEPDASDSRIHRGAENPKYRRSAVEIEEAASQDPPRQTTTRSVALPDGLAVRCTYRRRSGELACLLTDPADGDRVVGHVLSKDAGFCDEDLRGVARRLFPARAAVSEAARMVGLISVAVDPAKRGSRVGQALMRVAMEFYADAGFDFVLLQHRDTGSGRLVAWYKELGFAEAFDFIELAMLAPCDGAAQ